MMKNRKINIVREWSEDRLRRLCGRITPDKRVPVILAMLVLFGGGSIYMTISSIYNFGKDKGRRMEIERMETLKLRQEPVRDSINLQNYQYERTNE